MSTITELVKHLANRLEDLNRRSKVSNMVNWQCQIQIAEMSHAFVQTLIARRAHGILLADTLFKADRITNDAITSLPLNSNVPFVDPAHHTQPVDVHRCTDFSRPHECGLPVGSPPDYPCRIAHAIYADETRIFY